MKYLEIKLPKCVVYLTPEEINKLLQSDRTLFSEALRRGKGFTRHKQQKERERQKFEQSGG